MTQTPNSLALPELTVAMPAFNTSKYIACAIEGILAQENVDLEIVVVDDCSTDDTVAVVQSIDDPRITLLQNDRRRGIAYCHNRIVQHSRAPFITHMDSDDIVLPGALAKLLDLIRSDDRIGQVHCYFFMVSEDGTTTQSSARQRWHELHNRRPPDMDYRRELLAQGSVMNGLRTYRREVFDQVGLFNEKLTYGVDLEMALRLIEQYEMRLVPEFLYCARVHTGSTTNNFRIRQLRFWWQRLGFVRRLVNEGQIQFPLQPAYRYQRIFLECLRKILSRPVVDLQRAVKRTVFRSAERMHLNVLEPGLSRFYAHSTKLLPVAQRQASREPLLLANKKVAHYQWRFPSISQTFVRREIQGFRRAGLDLQLVADIPGDMVHTREGEPWVADTIYLPHDDPELTRKYHRRLLAKNPIRYALAMARVARYQAGNTKCFADDKVLFREAICLAGVLNDHGIDHVHSAWADSRAFVAQIAAALLGITCSVQARAHDLHRKSFQRGLTTRLSGADLVLTNSHFNKRHIESLFSKESPPRLECIYNGVELGDLVPRQRQSKSGPIRILSVARLIEEKGLLYLMDACRLLLDSGVTFECEIVGGPEEPYYSEYRIDLMKRHRSLGLDRHVYFRGPREYAQVVECYARADIFVLPCVIAKNGGRDISPNSLLEAMAMQLPVVTSNIAALPELVEDGVSGLLVPPCDAVALSNAIERLITNPGLRETLGANARKRISNQFDTVKNTRAMADLLLNGTLLSTHLADQEPADHGLQAHQQ